MENTNGKISDLRMNHSFEPVIFRELNSSEKWTKLDLKQMKDPQGNHNLLSDVPESHAKISKRVNMLYLLAKIQLYAYFLWD